MLEANRTQLEWRSYDLESTLPEEHEARLIWAALGRLDLSRFYEGIAARESRPGRPPNDPRVTLCLWIYATSQGVGSARELESLCSGDDAYRWILGGLSVNHHSLSDFRNEHGDAVDGLMTELLGVLMHKGLVTLKRVAQDGMRVRASAGASSFRRESTLKKSLAEARAQVSTLRQAIEQEPAAHAARQRAAKQRAAEEREQALTNALAQMPAVKAAKKRSRKRGKRKVSPARVSTTDPEARVMKMPDGGYRPAYNVQLATDTGTRFIVGVDVSNIGSDMSLMTPMLEQIEKRLGRAPVEHLVDGGFAAKEAIDCATARGVTVFAPVLTPAKKRRRGSKPTWRDSNAVRDWRARMKTEAAKTIYKQRASTAETVNADLRCWRGLDRFRVRGTTKVLAVIRLAAFTYNLRRLIRLERPVS